MDAASSDAIRDFDPFPPAHDERDCALGFIRIALSPLGSSMLHGSGMVPVTYSKAVVRDRLVMVGSRDRPPPDSQTFG